MPRMKLTLTPRMKIKLGDEIEIFLVPYKKNTKEGRIRRIYPKAQKICIVAPLSVNIKREKMDAIELGHHENLENLENECSAI